MTRFAFHRRRHQPFSVGIVLSACVLCFFEAAGTTAQPATSQAAGVQQEQSQSAADGKSYANYNVHQSIELGWRLVGTQGNEGMWDTLVNLRSGGRILSDSLEMHTQDRKKTPWFDRLSSESFGYGGDPNSVSMLNLSKGRVYNFAGSFRRDRLYFDDNLLANSLNANPSGLVPEIDSPHLYNTVRRNTDTLFTLAPLSKVSVRAGFRYNISEGPSFSSTHEGADALLTQLWRNALQTWIAGLDWKPAPRTTISYDQLWLHYKGDTRWQLTGLNAQLPNGQPVSYGLDPGSPGCPAVVAGVGSPNCSGYLAFRMTQPIRTNYPTEQFRFASRYWSRVAFNGRVLYSDATSVVPIFSDFYNGLTTRTHTRQQTDAGAGPGGRLAFNRRVNVNGDMAIDAEITKSISVSDAFNYWAFRIPGRNDLTTTVWAGDATTNLLTPVNSLTPVTSATTNLTWLNQAVAQNTVTAIFRVHPQLNLSAGYRFRSRHITDAGPDDLAFHEHWEFAGAAWQSRQRFRVNADYEHMNSINANAATPSNTFTRLWPDEINHITVRGTFKVNDIVTLTAGGSDFEGANNDPLVNHREHNRDISLDATVAPRDTLSFDLSVAHQVSYSRTDICYVETPAPAGAVNAGTCTADNSGGNGGPAYLLGNGLYDAPSTFFSGMLTWSPIHRLRFNGGTRLNYINGTAEMLNPNMEPGALQSTYLTPFVDGQFDIDKGWIWHANWTRDDYAERGAAGILFPRNVHGDIVTLSVRYAF